MGGDVRRTRNDLLDGPLDGGADIGLALVQAARRQPLILPETEVQVGQMHETHAGKLVDFPLPQRETAG